MPSVQNEYIIFLIMLCIKEYTQFSVFS